MQTKGLKATKFRLRLPKEVDCAFLENSVFILVPSAVRGLRAHPMNNKNSDEKGVVALIWKKPRQANGKIQKYIVGPSKCFL